MSRNSLQQVFSAAWHDAHPVAPGNATVLHASAGYWQATARCATPRAWLFLVGHWRAFSSTQRGLAHAMNASTDSCFFCVLVVPETYDVDAQQHVPWAPKLGVFRDRGSMEALAKKAQSSFGGRLAYAVLRRYGALDSFEFCLHLNWYAGWAVARWAAAAHSIRIDPASPVVRTRPDVFLRRGFDADRLRRLFRHGGSRAQHMMIALPQLLPDGVTLNPKNKNDVMAVFSFASYETGVALPMDLAGRMSSAPPPPPPILPRRVSECVGKPFRLCLAASGNVTPSSSATRSSGSAIMHASSSATAAPAASDASFGTSGGALGDGDRARTLLQARLLYERGVASGWGRMRAYFYDWRPRDGMSTFAQFVNHINVMMGTSGFAWAAPCAERCVCVPSPWTPIEPRIEQPPSLSRLAHAHHTDHHAEDSAPNSSSVASSLASRASRADQSTVGACPTAGEVPSCLLSSSGSLVMAQEFIGGIVRPHANANAPMLHVHVHVACGAPLCYLLSPYALWVHIV